MCECCLEGKAARLPFTPVVERKASRILDIVHTDLCGPMDNITPSGNRYAMTITDDFSRFTVTYLLKQKSEAAAIIKEYVKWVENLFNRKPLVVRSDGGGEFINKELRNFYKQQGIQSQYTTAYSPQQNGIAERKIRSLTEMVRCMLIDAGMEKRFWGEAMLTATYIQNRLPSRSIQKTPFELWWGRKPDLSHFRVFGSQAYVHVPDTKRKKLDSKARKLTFVGYAMEQKAYRFLDIETDQIIVSRDARFIEMDNGSTSVEVHVESKKKNETVAENGKDIEMVLLKEGKEEVLEESSEEYYEPEASSSPNIRRSGRSNLGSRPRHLEDYDLEYAVGFAACAVEGPIDYKEAIKDRVWREAMLEELESHRRNKTWKLVPLPEGKKAIGSKWVHKQKRNEEKHIVKHKARLVAQGFAQRSGVDVDDVFAPVTCQPTFRTFLAIAAKRKMVVRHLDVKTAYLYGSLEEEVFMRQPPGFVVPGKEHWVCCLQRASMDCVSQLDAGTGD